MIVDNVKVSADFDLTESEAANYVRYVKERAENPVQTVEVHMCDDGKVDVNYEARGEKFERIRRITGYLTGSLETWNDAKQAEESERVKHNGRGF